MDSISRLARLAVFFIVGLFLGGYATWASALDPVPAERGYCPSYGCGTNISSWSTSVAGACSKHAQAHSMQPASCYSSNEVTREYKYIYTYNGKTYPQCSSCIGNQWAIVAYKCSDGWTLQGETCYPPQPNCPEAGTPQSSGWFLMGPSPTSSFPGITCAGSCLVAFNGDAPAGTATVSGVKQYYARGTWQYLGPSNTCTGADTTPPAQTSLPANTCAPGMQGGYVNGKWTCVNPSTGETQPQSTPVPQPPKTETTETTTTTNPDSSTTTTTTTNHGDGSTTTTITITLPNGDKEETTTHTPADKDPQETFCEENPDSPICKDSNFGGDCGSFTCDGDAIQCAIAQHQHQKRCDDENAHTQNSFIAQAKSILEGGSDSVTDPIATPETRSLGSFDTSDMLTAGCPSPRSYTVLGASFTINYQPFCDIAAIVKIFLVVGALLLGGRIVVGGI